VPCLLMSLQSLLTLWQCVASSGTTN